MLALDENSPLIDYERENIDIAIPRKTSFWRCISVLISAGACVCWAFPSATFGWALYIPLLEDSLDIDAAAMGTCWVFTISFSQAKRKIFPKTGLKHH